MKAAIIREFGSSDVFRYEEVKTPHPAPGHVLIKVAACGLNRYDLYLRMGAITRDMPLPHVMGADITGHVAAIGDSVTGFTENQRVIAAPGFPVNPEDWAHTPINQAPSYTVTGTLKWGGYAEYVTIPSAFVIPDPTDIPQDELATVPLCLTTAVHAVKTLGQVSRDTTVLIQAGASGSGGMCIQVARTLGARIITTVGSEPKVDFVKRLGANEVIRRDQEDQVARVMKWTDNRGVDVVIDNVGAAVFDANTKSLRLGGTFVNFGLVSGYKVDFDLKEFFFRQHTFKGSFMGTMEEIAHGMDLVRTRQVKPLLDRSFPLRDARQAHDYIDARKVRGSVVLVP